MSVVQNVSRETQSALRDYAAEVKKWNKAINLVSKASVEEIWERHIIDSLQIFPLAGDFQHWIDLGSGGGFPGIVCAIAAKEANPGAKFTLVESDVRKSAFLLKMSIKFDLNMKVLPQRIADCSAQAADIVSARALSSLEKLLSHSVPLLAANGTCIFPKGKTYETEINDARKEWSFDCDVIDSKTSADAAILRIRNVSRKD